MPIGVNGRCVMRSPIAGSGRLGSPTTIKPYPESRATLDKLLFPCVVYITLDVGDLNYNHFQPNNEAKSTNTALQRNNAARQDQADSNEEAHRRHYSSTFTNDDGW